MIFTNNEIINKKSASHKDELFKLFDNIAFLFNEKDKKVTNNEYEIKRLKSENQNLLNNLKSSESQIKILKEKNSFLYREVEKLNEILNDIKYREDYMIRCNKNFNKSGSL